ncbi:IMPACT family protein [Dyadobacter sandarakinus]|uniref:YigZ family protein n=1 Tax=Dyadobacter sandarakinus TaxID=2747268 RepID=A0ABX7IB45_9BACT|nr:YigZ family protein [Dyadobacter sandarakinus]QRR03331.1 YigZ family protein [Dyadobacter sandarakinus]
MLFDDTYRTIAEPAEGFFKDKGSKFFSYAYPLHNESEAKACLAALYELHPKAVHHCYAYRLGTDRMSYRMSDDGEPAGTAGRPILNMLYSKDVTNLLVVVVRYFGGTLLGVPGLINAYKTATEEALNAAEIIVRHFSSTYQLHFGYLQMNDVMRIVKEMELPVLAQAFEMECSLTVEVRSSLIEPFMTRTGKVEGVNVQLLG